MSSALFPRILQTRDKRNLVIREGDGQDAGLVLTHLERVCAETDFLSFGPGEFEMDEREEAVYLDRCLSSENCVYLLAFVDQTLAGSLNFSSRNRKRLIHVGEFGITVQLRRRGRFRARRGRLIRATRRNRSSQRRAP